jgi:hypothetical protein
MIGWHLFLADVGLALMVLAVLSGVLLTLARRVPLLGRRYVLLLWLHLGSGVLAFVVYLLTYFLAPTL